MYISSILDMNSYELTRIIFNTYFITAKVSNFIFSCICPNEGFKIIHWRYNLKII